MTRHAPVTGTGALLGIRTADQAAGQADGTEKPSPVTLSCGRVVAPPRPRVNRSAQVSVITLTGGLAVLATGSLAQELADIAVSAFTAPPWNRTPAQARQLAERMLTDARCPGFALALASTAGGMRLAGFGYGLPRHPALDGAADPFRGTGTRPFEFCELAVRPEARGLGTGRALHDAVLAASGPQLRWLVTHPAARPAVRLYQTGGWQIRQVFPSTADGGSQLLMTRHR